MRKTVCWAQLAKCWINYDINFKRASCFTPSPPPVPILVQLRKVEKKKLEHLQLKQILMNLTFELEMFVPNSSEGGEGGGGGSYCNFSYLQQFSVTLLVIYL